MIVEAIDTLVTYRWPGGKIRLEPGNPVELPKERAERLLVIWRADRDADRRQAV